MSSATMVAPDSIPCVHALGGIIMVGGPVYTIRGEEGNTFTFEWHPMWGPTPVSPTTHEILKKGTAFYPERSKFWALFDRWTHGGKKIDALGRCILSPIPPSRLSARPGDPR